jgi:hypothetical protein
MSTERESNEQKMGETPTNAIAKSPIDELLAVLETFDRPRSGFTRETAVQAADELLQHLQGKHLPGP